MKKLLLSLFVGLFSLIGFGYCVDLSVPGGSVGVFHLTSDGYSTEYKFPSSYKFMFYNLVDASSNKFGGYCGYSSRNCSFSPTSVMNSITVNNYTDVLNQLITLTGSCIATCTMNVYGSSTVDLMLYNPDGGTCPDCPTCDDPYTSLECQTEYNLIPVEDVDTNYCVGNGLCPNECGSGTDFSGDLQYSNIYINSILHPGEENIFINIPDYIQWDYSVDTGNFNVYVGSGYDMDYMNSIIKINSYRPTSSDFTNIFVSGLTLIFPYIFVLLLIVFMWKLIKRVFK